MGYLGGKEDEGTVEGELITEEGAADKQGGSAGSDALEAFGIG